MSWDAAAADWYAKHHGDRATNRLAVDSLDLETDAVVVDLGCGAGEALRHAAARVTRGQLIGVDPVPRMLEIARTATQNHPVRDRIRFVLGSAVHLPLADRSVHVVLALDCFDYWQDISGGMAEVRRVLRSDGQLLVSKDLKDANAQTSSEALATALREGGFEVRRVSELRDETVWFRLWRCEVHVV